MGFDSYLRLEITQVQAKVSDYRRTTSQYPSNGDALNPYFYLYA